MVDSRPRENKRDLVFLTDRNDEGGAEWQTRFGSRLLANWRLSCGRVYFGEFPLREVGQTYRQRLISLDTEQLVVGTRNCIDLISDRAKASNTTNIMVFLHGYNNSFEDTIARARAFADDIQFKGLVLTWAWPSQGWIFGYLDDEKAVSWSAEHFIDFMTTLMRTQKFDVDFVAHSMGNRILVDLAAALRNEPQETARALVFAAPDVAKDEFVQKISPKHFQTLYASADDRSLQVSSNYLHWGPRAGMMASDTGILVVDGVESIDAIIHGHSYIFEDPRALRDVGRLLITQEKASARGLTERWTGFAKYWVINP